MSSERAVIDVLRSLAHGSISGTYAAVGSAVTQIIRLVCITNNTDGDMFFSDDGVNDKLFIPKGSFKLFDVTTNRDNKSSGFGFPVSTQYYVRQSSAPSTGSVYIEIVYGYGDVKP